MPTVKELQQLAKQKGVPYTGLRKAELINVLGDLGLMDKPQTAIKKPKLEKKPIQQVAQPIWSPGKVKPISEKKIEMAGIHKKSESIMDLFGKEIFDVFTKKYNADKIFERGTNKILDLYNKQRLLSPADRDYLVANVIEPFHEIYDKFISRVNKERRFVEKSASGKPPRDIVTATDWAEAIIELQDLVEKFKQALDSNIKDRSNPSKMIAYCEKIDPEKCDYPCKKKVSRIGKDKCIY